MRMLSQRVLSTVRRSQVSSSLLSLHRQALHSRLYPLPCSTRFFSSNQHHLQRWVRHPRTDRGPQNNGFFNFLDSIPKNVVFNGILAINGVVFFMWYMSSQRQVSPFLPFTMGHPHP